MEEPKMKKSLRLRYLFIALLSVVLVSVGLEWQDTYRKNAPFRTMQDPLASTESVDVTGLRELPFAGGPLMPLPALKKHLAFVKDPIIIVDGIHGKFGYIQGVPEQYLKYHKESLSWRTYLWRLWYTGTLFSQPQLIIPAEKAAALYGFGYRSFRIGSKYLSEDKDIDAFVSFMDSLPKHVFLYFHCIHGKGRTSMMLVMADIMKNAPQVALEDIIKRQHLLGSVDLFDTAPWTRSTYATKTLEDRKTFIERFYDFISQRKAGALQTWSAWNQTKP
jgi:hypothetical protein